MSALHHITERFQGKRILVIGDAILDAYIKGVSERLCREAPAPVIALRERTWRCGGASNTAINLAALGAQVTFLTVIGADAHGDVLVRRLQQAGVDTQKVVRSEQRVTVAKTRISAASSILLRLDEGTTEPIDPFVARQLSEIVEKAAEHFDALVISDYDNGVINEEIIQAAASVAQRIVCVVDARSPARFRGIRPTAVKPNYTESIRLLGLPAREGQDRVGQIIDAGDSLLEMTAAQLVYATLDGDGSLLLRKNRKPHVVPCIPRTQANTIGAGDSYVGALTLALCSGASPEAAARIASAAAAVVLDKEGTCSCSHVELRAALKGNLKCLDGLDDLRVRVEEFRRHGKRIVFTNGCFDILHRGHVHFLRRAKELGEVLIVGLNSDESIRRIKGKDRPINQLSDRIEVLAGLQSVDCMVAFDEDSPIEILKTIRPDVFVKGGAHTDGSIPEAELVRRLGGDVRVIPAAKGFSTSKLIQKINGRRAAESPVSRDSHLGR